MMEGGLSCPGWVLDRIATSTGSPHPGRDFRPLFTVSEAQRFRNWQKWKGGWAGLALGLL